MSECRSRYMIKFDEEEQKILIEAVKILSANNVDKDRYIRQNCGSRFVEQLNIISCQINDLLEFGYIREE